MAAKSAKSRRRGGARWARYGLVAVAAVIGGAVFMLTNSGFEDENISISGIDLTDLSDGLRLSNPRFTGETAKGEPFTLSAAWALPDGPSPENVELNDVSGEIYLADGRLIEVSAREGLFRPKIDTVNVEGNVTIKRSDGYELSAAKAELDVMNRVLTAEGDVRASSPEGEITAGSMRIERGEDGSGDHIWFENRVHLRIMQPNKTDKP